MDDGLSENDDDDDDDYVIGGDGSEGIRVERRGGQRVRRRRDGHDSDADIEYGYRMSRRRTSYEHRGSSSLTPAQIMEQETHYRYAEVAIQRVAYILQLILLHQASYVHLRLTIRQWSVISAVSVAGAIESARERMQHIIVAVNRIFFAARWIRGHGEIALLYAEDLTTFIRRRHRFGLARCRRIDDVPLQDCYAWFGHVPHNLHRLHRHLRVPPTFTATSGQIYGGEECFLVYLYHLTKGTPFTEMARFVFGGDPRRLSEMNALFIDY